MKLKIRNFKGLIAYGDVADNELEYASEFVNCYVEPGYIRSNGISINNLGTNIPSDETILTLKIIYLDEDLYKDRLEVHTLKLINDYKPDIRKYLLAITKKNNSYYLYISEGEQLNFTKIDFEYSSDLEENPFIYNDNKVAKVFFREKSFVVKRYHRHYFDGHSYPVYGSIKANTLVYKYSPSNNILGRFRVITDFNAEPPVRVDLERVGNSTYTDRNSNKTFRTVAYKMIKDNTFIPYSKDEPFFHIFPAEIRRTNSIEHCFVIYRTNNENFFPEYNNIFTQTDTIVFIKQVNSGQPDTLENASTLGDYKIYYTNANYTTFLPNILLNLAHLNSYNDTFKFTSKDILSIITTVTTDQGEFIFNLTDIPNQTSNYILKLEDLDYLYLYDNKDIIAVNFYLGIKSYSTEPEEKYNIVDYELIHTINLRKSLYNPLSNFIYINKLTSDGIKLFQRIGTIFTNEYEIMDGFTDYIVINGIGFVIKNGNIYYNAVGNGKPLINNYYSTNIIPHINGEILVKVGSNLGIVDKLKNKIVILDYQPVETNLIFYVKGELENTPKNKLDIIDTPGGSIINTREGILLSNGTQTSYIATQIRDFLRDNFETTKIILDTKNSLLYIISSNKIYSYNILNRSVSEHILDIDNIKDFTADEDGNVYIIADNIKKLILSNNVTSKVGFKNIDLQEISILKKINNITFDFEGILNFNGRTYQNEYRKFTVIPIRYDERKYKNFIEFGFEFTGKVYSLEIDYEYINYNKY